MAVGQQGFQIILNSHDIRRHDDGGKLADHFLCLGQFLHDDGLGEYFTFQGSEVDDSFFDCEMVE